MASVEQDAWVERVLSVAVPGVGTPSLEWDAVAAEVKDRLAMAHVTMRLLNADRDLAVPFRDAAEAAKQDPQAAFAALDRLEAELAAISGQRRTAAARVEIAAAGAGTQGVSAVAKARLAWNKVKAEFDRASDNLVAGLYALMATEEFAADPRSALPETFDAIDALEYKFPALDRLADSIDDMLDQRAPAEAAIRAIDTYLAALDVQAELGELEELSGGPPSVSLLREALGDLRAALQEPASQVQDAAA